MDDIHACLRHILHSPSFENILVKGALDEAIIAGGAGVGDNGSILSVAIEDNAIGTGGTASKDLEGAEDGVFVPRARDVEGETLVIIVLVWVVVLGLTVLQQRVSVVQGSVDVRLPVAGAATGCDASLAGLQGSSGVDIGEEEEGDGGNLYYDELVSGLKTLPQWG